MKVGDKIRDLRTLKKLSQQNMAEMLDMLLGAYGDIERDKKKDLTLARLEQIANVLGVSVLDILSFGDTVSNFFDQCSTPQVNTGTNNQSHTFTNNNYEIRETQHKLDKALLENEKLKAEKEKAELEAKYWREKCEKENN